MRSYNDRLTASVNIKGVLDVDTVKGCSRGILAYPCGGCYGACYAFASAKCRGFDFSRSVSRHIDRDAERHVENAVRNHALTWFRIGTMGDPCHDWELTCFVAEWLSKWKRPVVVTKHWIECPSVVMSRLARAGAVFNTSVSALDTEPEREYRIDQFYRAKKHGAKSCLRVVSCRFGETDEGRYMASVQSWIMAHGSVIDTPLRIPATDSRVIEGTILVSRERAINSEITVSRMVETTHVGRCETCPDQCGATMQ